MGCHGDEGHPEGQGCTLGRGGPLGDSPSSRWVGRERPGQCRPLPTSLGILSPNAVTPPGASQSVRWLWGGSWPLLCAGGCWEAASRAGQEDAPAGLRAVPVLKPRVLGSHKLWVQERSWPRPGWPAASWELCPCGEQPISTTSCLPGAGAWSQALTQCGPGARVPTAAPSHSAQGQAVPRGPREHITLP